MPYTEKFQTMSDHAMARVDAVEPSQVDTLVAAGAILLDIRDKEEHDKSNITGSVNLSRGKLEMNIEGIIPDLNTTIIWRPCETWAMITPCLLVVAEWHIAL